MHNINKRVMEHTKEIINKNRQRTRKILNAPIEVKKKSVKANLILSILLIVLYIVNLSTLGSGILILGIVAFAVNVFLLNKYKKQ